MLFHRLSIVFFAGWAQISEIKSNFQKYVCARNDWLVGKRLGLSDFFRIEWTLEKCLGNLLGPFVLRFLGRISSSL